MPNYAAATIEYGSGPTSKTLLALVKELTTTTGVTDDSWTMYLQMAGEAAERYTDNTIAAKQVVQTLKRSRSRVKLSYWPYIDDDTLLIEIDGQDVTADYEIIYEAGVPYAVECRHEMTVSCELEPMLLTYNAGHDPLPTELGYVLARTAMAYERQAGNTAGPVKRESVVGVGTVEYDTGMEHPNAFGLFTGASLTVLDCYRRFVG